MEEINCRMLKKLEIRAGTRRKRLYFSSLFVHRRSMNVAAAHRKSDVSAKGAAAGRGSRPLCVRERLPLAEKRHTHCVLLDAAMLLPN